METAVIGLVRLLESRIPPKELERQMPASPEGEDPKVKAAALLKEAVSAQPLTRREKRLAGPVVHYLVGAALGVIYGWGAARFSAFRGERAALAFGTTTWLAFTETALPLLGLSRSP